MNGDWTPDVEMREALNESLWNAIKAYEANPHLLAEHVGLEDSMRHGGYANRALLELVQNGADAMSSASGRGQDGNWIEIVLDQDTQTLYCANEGVPFSPAGLQSLVHAYLSAKRGEEIGRFGLGFKSVLAVTDSPQVFSRSISFEFNSPQAQAILRQSVPGVGELPVLRTPTPIENVVGAFEADPILNRLSGWAATIVKLPGVKNPQSILSEMINFRYEFLLFVDAVREVRLTVVGGGQPSSTQIYRSVQLSEHERRIVLPDGSSSDWIINDEMHKIDDATRRQVGRAVGRERVKISVAIPKSYQHLKVGNFWAYFPLQDTTTASALFNAPWSINDDRTTLLKNNYNQEIIKHLASMFVKMLPGVMQDADPAAHLDYLPARGREILSYGDDLMCEYVPAEAARATLVPDARGVLNEPSMLRPLNFQFREVSAEDYMHWIQSPGTGDDVPHWKCYTTPQRTSRLRRMYAFSIDQNLLGGGTRDEQKMLAKVPSRGLLSWLTEWASGDAKGAAGAFAFVLSHPKIEDPDIRQARVIPTDHGLKSLEDRPDVYLRGAEDIEVEGASYIDPGFLAVSGIEKNLKDRGFREVDAESILRARLEKLSPVSGQEEFEKFWEATLNLPAQVAARIVRSDNQGYLRVPTLDGQWKIPGTILDFDEIGNLATDRRLDRSRCQQQVAWAAGVVHSVVSDYSLEDETCQEQYYEQTITLLNDQNGPSATPVERIDFDQNTGPGPVSVLLLMKEAGASDVARAHRTQQLVEAGGSSTWTCEDVNSPRTFQVPSPANWAVNQAGLVATTKGFRPPSQAVADALNRYQGLLPTFKGPRQVEDVLDLPREVMDVPAEVLREALASDFLPPTLKDSLLVEFILQACSIAHPSARPPKIPARIGKTVQSAVPDQVYLATTDEQQNLLQERDKHFLRVTEAEAEQLFAQVGCKRFEDSFSFSTIVRGDQDAEGMLELYPGLQQTWAGTNPKVVSGSVVRAMNISKRVTTPDGVEDQPLEWTLKGLTLVVLNKFSDTQVLRLANQAFELGLNNAQLAEVEKFALDQDLERMRQEALAAENDADRLEVFFGDDTLKDNLPTGLWAALEAQKAVNRRTSVAEMFLTVYGSESVSQLQGPFRELGYTDVPDTWAGGGRTIDWLRKMGFAVRYAGSRSVRLDNQFMVPGAVKLTKLHDFQKTISEHLRQTLTVRTEKGAQKAMVELPTGAGKTRVATQTVLRLFEDVVDFRGHVLWIAQSMELCEQAVQTFSTVWRGLGYESPLSISRLWDDSVIYEPEADASIIVATDAKLEAIMDNPAYGWLKHPQAVIVDEAHRTAGKRYKEIFRWLGVDEDHWDRPLVGLSATPFKGDADGNQTDELVARFGNNRLTPFAPGQNPYTELQDQGILARIDHEILPGVYAYLSPGEVEGISRGHLIDSAVLERLGRDHARMKVLVDHIMTLDPEWPVLVFTPSVLSAQVLAASLRYKGVSAASISGDTSKNERRKIIKDFNDGKTRVLANCDLLAQGFDAPGVRALYIARPTFSPSAYIQMAGRGLRGKENGGKEKCLIVDVADNFGAANDFLGYRAYEQFWEQRRA